MLIFSRMDRVTAIFELSDKYIDAYEVMFIISLQLNANEVGVNFKNTFIRHIRIFECLQ